MKVLFLDIDGVVNSEESLRKATSAGDVIGIDKYMAFLVGKIQLDTGCEIVLSSSWRGWKEGEDAIEKKIGKIFDRTLHLSGERGKEIRHWLYANPGVTKYAILDDTDDMMPEQRPNFFRTLWKVGITKEIADAVTVHLNT